MQPCWRATGSCERRWHPIAPATWWRPPPPPPTPRLCLERQVAIKKVLQDKRFKNRELQIMKLLNHQNIVKLKHCFFR